MRGKRESEKRISVASAVRQAVMGSSDRIWTYADFADLEMGAVSQALSRLSREGLIKRVRKGVYYRPKQTVLGESKASPAAVSARLLSTGARPTGLTAANALGLTTQNPARPSYAVSKSNAPTNLPGVKVRVRRPVLNGDIQAREAAILEFLRDRGQTSDLSPEEIVTRLLQILSDDAVFSRVAEAALNEPPRVRAMLGALGQEAGIPTALLLRLKQSLNALSRYDFGHLRSLQHAREWQAK
jgi:hypothetical protein